MMRTVLVGYTIAFLISFSPLVSSPIVLIIAGLMTEGR